MMRWFVLAALAALAAVLVLGANALSFLCDDAFITFRYVSNAHDGHGLVWNVAPFAPVEGYSCFAWAMMLWAAWSWFGIEPPDSANAMSIGLGLVQFAIVMWAALSIRQRDGSRARDAVGLVALFAIVTNRTFLQWLTGGLETALFNVAFVGWVLWAFRHRAAGPGWLAGWSSLAALAALTRPDGLLLVVAVAAIGIFGWWRKQRAFGAVVVGLLPLLAVAAHVVWRRSFYGEWLPNTYYAKVVDAWPEAGVRYLTCFVVEHGTWVVPLIALAWLLNELRRPRELLRAIAERPAALAAVGVVLCHVGYYTFRVGGDHFEYRVFSQLVPLSALAVAAMAARMSRGSWWPVVATMGLTLASTVGWLHFALTRDLPLHGFQPLSQRLPAVVAPLARWYDRHQAWLLFHNVGLRCQQQAMFVEQYRADFPGRLSIVEPPDPYPAFAIGAVGVVGWCLHDCAILDIFGLNDWVIARSPTRNSTKKRGDGLWATLVQAANTNGDDWLDRDELHRAFVVTGARGNADAEVKDDFLTRVVLAIHATERFDALSIAEAEQVGDMVAGARSMAHDRQPPVGYIEDFAPNVTVLDGVATVRPRAVPLTADRVREIENTWRERVRAASK